MAVVISGYSRRGRLLDGAEAIGLEHAVDLVIAREVDLLALAVVLDLETEMRAGPRLSGAFKFQRTALRQPEISSENLREKPLSQFRGKPSRKTFIIGGGQIGFLFTWPAPGGEKGFATVCYFLF